MSTKVRPASRPCGTDSAPPTRPVRCVATAMVCVVLCLALVRRAEGLVDDGWFMLRCASHCLFGCASFPDCARRATDAAGRAVGRDAAIDGQCAGSLRLRSGNDASAQDAEQHRRQPSACGAPSLCCVCRIRRLFHDSQGRNIYEVQRADLSRRIADGNQIVVHSRIDPGCRCCTSLVKLRTVNTLCAALMRGENLRITTWPPYASDDCKQSQNDWPCWYVLVCALELENPANHGTKQGADVRPEH